LVESLEERITGLSSENGHLRLENSHLEKQLKKLGGLSYPSTGDVKANSATALLLNQNILARTFEDFLLSNT
jgi:regulator of replication initiation timing